jgi:CheY-like chemotaxis protein
MNIKNNELTGQNILVCDDNEITRDSLRRIFELQGARVYSTGHLEKASSVLSSLLSRGNLPTLIITDIKLPGMYGLDVLRQFQDVLGRCKVPILLISLGLSDFVLTRASLYGVVGYAQKPILIKDLFAFSMEIIEAHKCAGFKAKSLFEKNAA